MFIDLSQNYVYSEYHFSADGELDWIYFPMGELHCKFPPVHVEDDKADVLCRVTNSEDIMKLMLVSNILDNKGIEKRHLILPYLPYSRQDRITSYSEPYSIKVLCELIKNLGYNRVTTVDVHSNAPTYLLGNLYNYVPYKECQKWLNDLGVIPEETTLICPDAGAQKRTEKYNTILGFKEIIYCLKNRDSETGTLSGFQVLGKIQTENALVVDDICDGGGTFLGLGDKLKEAGANKLLLWVAHGGFTKGVDELLKRYEAIGYVNSYSPIAVNNRKVHQVLIDFKNI